MRQLFFFQKNNSGQIARSRLKLLLISDKTHINPNIVDMIRSDMIGVLSRYVEVDTGHLDINICNGQLAGTSEMTPILSASVPIRQLTIKRNEECF